jgi:hypothetical protein
MKTILYIFILSLLTGCYKKIYDPTTGKKVKPKMERVKSKTPMAKLGGE